MEKNKTWLAKPKLPLILLSLIFIAGLIIRIKPALNWILPSTYDTGRDLLAVKEIVVNKKLTLIGPTTGIPGVFHGAWWYYLLTIPFIITQGDPRAAIVFLGICGSLSIIFSFILTRLIFKSNRLSLITAILVALSPQYLNSSGSAWNPNMIPGLVLIWLLFIWLVIQPKPKPLFAWLLGLTTGFIFEFGVGSGIFLIPLTICLPILIKAKPSQKLKLAGLIVLGLALPMLPRLVFELRHNWFMTQSLVTHFAQGGIRGQALAFWPRLLNRLDLFNYSFSQLLPANLSWFFWPLVILALVQLVRSFKAKTRANSDLKLFYLLICLTLMTFFGLLLIFKDTVWVYYLISLPGLALPLVILPLAKFKKLLQTGLLVLLIGLLSFSLLKSLTSQTSVELESDPAVLKHQLEVVNFIFNQDDNQFAYFVYTPPIYPYQYQYLFWWQSRQLGLVNPSGQPQTDRPTYIIMEPDPMENRRQDWYLGNVVGHGDKLAEWQFPGRLTVEKWQFK